MSNTENRSKYRTHVLDRTIKGVPYAVQLEGYVSNPAPYFKAAEGEKGAFLSTSIGLPCPYTQLLALANGEYDREKTYEGSEFADLKLFGKRAEKFSSVLNKGRHVVVAGLLKEEDFTRKDSTTGKKLVIEVDNLIDAGQRQDNVEAQLGDDISVVTTAYTTKDGVNHTVPMACTLSGTVTGCRGLATGSSGVPYLSFGIKTKMPAEKVFDLVNGTYDKSKAYNEKKTIINVVVFRKDAERLSKVLTDGAMVVVSGPVEAREYNGNTSYQLRPRLGAVTIIKFGPRADGSAAPAGTAAASAAEVPDPSAGGFTMDDDGDDELPF